MIRMMPVQIKVSVIACSMLFFTSCGTNQRMVPLTNFNINRGVNIGNWLSGPPLNHNRRSTVFTTEDVNRLAGYGFDHLRIPVDEDNIFVDSVKVDKETISLIHQTIEQCQEKGMKVIIDLHSTRSHTFMSSKMDNNTLWNSKYAQVRIVKIWELLMMEFEKYSEKLVAYELLNEPTAEKDEQWNRIANLLIKTIRKKNKKRIIVLGSNRWNYVGNLEKLEIPENDPNIILSFHFYEPMLLTHYEASFNKFANLRLPEKIQYPGKLFSDSVYNILSVKDKELVNPYRKEYNKQYFRSKWIPAIKYAKSKGLRLYLGEFGCLPNAGEGIRLVWLSDVVSLCKEYNIAYSLWEYNNVFGFAERGTGKIRNQEMLKILTE